MLNIANYQRNANQNSVKYHLLLVRMAISKTIQTINDREGGERRELSYTAGGNVNWYSHYGEQYGGP